MPLNLDLLLSFKQLFQRHVRLQRVLVFAKKHATET